MNKPPFVSVPTTPRHQAARLALVDALRPFEELHPEELLAVSAQFVGQLIALQDQQRITPAQAMNLVAKNIEAGNMAAIQHHLGNPEGAA